MKKPSYLYTGIFLTLFSIACFGFLNNKPLEAKFVDSKLIDKIKQNLHLYNYHLPQEKVYLHFDKPLYKPGEDIWISAYIRNGIQKESEISEILHVELINPKGNTEKTLHLIAKNGITHGDFTIHSDMPGGLYKVKAYTQWMKNEGDKHIFEKEIQVQSVVLPRLLMKMDFERKAYGAGEEAVAKLAFSTPSNKPLVHYEFNFTAQLGGKELLKGKGTTDEYGKAYARIKLPKKLESNDGLLNVIIAYEGSQESISRSIPIVLNNIDLQFFPEGGDLIQDVESKVAFKAVNEFGKPADIEGEVLNEKNEKVVGFKSFHQGMGAFNFKPDGKTSYKVKITQPEGIEKTYLLPVVLSTGYNLKVTGQKRELIRVKVYAPHSTTLSLVAQVRGELYFSKAIKAKEGDNFIDIPLKNFPAGVAQMTLFDQKAIPRCERLIFVNQQKQLQVEISSDKEKYLPREKVNLTIKVRDENGLPSPGNFSLSVTDDKLISFADDKQAHILSWLLLNSDLTGKVEEPNFYFDNKEPKAAEALDYLMMTQGWRRFAWKEILQVNEVNLKNKFKYAAEKAVEKGKVIKLKDNEPVYNTKVMVLETEEVAYTDKEGKFEFKNLDLSSPRMLQVVDGEGKERIFQINDYAQEYLVGSDISGKVRSQKDGQPLSGLSVSVKGTNHGTLTDINGNYFLEIPEEGNTLVFSYLGYETKEINIKEKNKIDVELEENSWNLQEMLRGRIAGVVEKKIFEELQPESIAEEFEVNLNIEITEDKKEFQDEDTILNMMVFDEVAIIEIPDEEEVNEVFSIVEEMPHFPGGMEQLYKLISNNINYPRHAMALGIEGKVYVQFLVREDGTIADVFVIKGLGAGCDEEAVRAISELPNWEPGKQRGKPVATRMVLPITYNLNNYSQNNNSYMFQIASNAGYGMKAMSSKYYRAREFYNPVYKADEVTESRTDFRKTLYWSPSVKIDKTGSATLSFYNSDEVTSFRAIVEGIADEGLIGRQEFTYYTQLPFSMHTKIPEVLAFEDKVSIPITLKNNTLKKVTGTLQIEAPENLSLGNNWNQEVAIPAKGFKTIFIDCQVLSKGAGEGKLRFTFESDGLKDSFEQNIEIRSKGFPATISFSGNELSKTFNLQIRNMVQNSLNVKLTAYPDILCDLMAGIESILREPYGCFEQTSSSTYPNILALQYMESTGTINSKVREKALSYIHKGYKRLITFETKQNGYEWFGNTPPHEGLTAYGLMEFKDMEKVYASVDHKMVQRTASWILDQKDGKGGFNKSNEQLDGFGGASEAVSNAYIVYALSEAGYKDIDKELQKVLNTATSSGDAYQLALAGNTLFNLGKKKEAEAIVKKLSDMMDKDGMEGLKADHSITRSSGKSLQVETFSLVVLAMLKSENKEIKNLQKAVNYLVQARGSYGSFGSTQATILALKALTEFAHFSKRTATSGTIELLVGGKTVASKYYEKGVKDEIVLEGLEEFFHEGKQEITVLYKGTKDPLPYSVDFSWSTYTPNDSRECKVALKTFLSKKESKVGETVRLTANLRNITKEGLPMTIALIGIPSGLSVQPWQLKELLEKNKVDFYEMNKNYLVLYYRNLAPAAEHTINLDLKSEIPGNFEAPASSAYLYYTNEYKVWAGGERMVIK